MNKMYDYPQNFLNKLNYLKGFNDLKYEKVKVDNIKISNRTDILGYIKEKYIFIHHPYESFDIIVDMIKKSSRKSKCFSN